MFIDIHAHLVEEPVCPRFGKPAFATPGYLLKRHDALGIEKAVILPLVNVETSICCQSNEEALRIARKHPGRFIPFCNIDPRMNGNSYRTNLLEVMLHYRDKGCKGIGEICANLRFLDPKVQNLFASAERAGLPVLFHISPFEGYSYGLVDDAGLPGLEECLRRFPTLPFLGHSQAFWCEIGTYSGSDPRFGYPKGPVTEGRIAKLMRTYGNLYGDLSAGSGSNALTRDRGYAVKFLNEFQDRLLFGTDICAPDTPTPLVDFLLELRADGSLPEDAFQKIAHLNARKLLKLDEG